MAQRPTQVTVNALVKPSTTTQRVSQVTVSVLVSSHAAAVERSFAVIAG